VGIDATAPLQWDVERTSLPAEAIAAARDLLAGRGSFAAP
jgi:hypothetical protein